MTGEPQQEFLRRSQVERWLEPLGIHIKEIDRMRKNGLLRRITLRPGGRGYFVKNEILEVLERMREKP